MNMLSTRYVENWNISSRALDKLGMYEKILGRYDFRGKRVAQFGVGTGIETERIWQKNPLCILGLEHDFDCLDVSAEYLRKKGYPVNETRDIDGLAEPTGPAWRVKGDSINLAPADYTDASTIDLTLHEKFDFGVFTFVGGYNYFPVFGDSIIFDPLQAYDFLLKKGGILINAERILTSDPDGLQKEMFFVPAGYALKFFETEINRPAVEASMWGNNKIGFHGEGSLVKQSMPQANEGELAKLFLDSAEKEGLKPVIYRLEIEKV